MLAVFVARRGATKIGSRARGECTLFGIRLNRTGYAGANRPFFLEQVSRARNNLNRYWRPAWGDQTFPVSTQNEHQKILDLCVSRDRAGLTMFIERHIMTSGEVVLQYLQKNGS
jgi:DNA-binding GntR family transcriptional regulator